MTLLIRPLTPADAGSYRALRLRALAEHPAAFTSSAREEAHRPLLDTIRRLQAEPARPNDVFLGAFLDGALCGVVGLQGRYREKERHNATLVGLYVAPHCAGRGIGRSLVESLIGFAQARPELLQIDLTVTAGNAAAEGLYRRLGFIEWGRLERAIRVGPGFHAKVHMVRVLR